MATKVTGTGLLSLVADFGSEAPKSQLVSAAGYIRPDGRLEWTAFYEALLQARNVIPRPITRDEDEEYQDLSDELKGLYDEIHQAIGEKWDHTEIMGMMDKVNELAIETAEEFQDAFTFWTDNTWHWQREFVEDLLSNMGESVPEWITIDHETTWDSSLRYDYSEVEYDGAVYVFRNNF